MRDFEMLDNTNRLDLTTKDMELIEAALHTQKKILSMQSQAGGTGARQKLSELKHLMRRIGRSQKSADRAQSASWSDLARSFLRPLSGCSDCR